MPRIAYVNGFYRPHASAFVHIDDRGYQFADAVYEVLAVNGGKLIDETPHLRRLERSLGELKIPAPMTQAALSHIMRRVVRLNGISNGIVYLQISRGVAPRDHAFPKTSKPQIVVTARRKRALSPALFSQGVSVITIDDIRWGRCDIKSTSLLANVLGKQSAREAGAYEAWQVLDGFVTEGTASNAWIVTPDGVLITRSAGPEILNGITRQVVLRIAEAAGLNVEQRPFTLEEARTAQEAFITGTTAHVLPVVKLDDVAVGTGRPGIFTQKLLAHYQGHLADETE